MVDRIRNPSEARVGGVAELNPEALAEALDTDLSAIYLDVRTVEEFAAGHSPRALNVPLYVRSPSTGMVVDNADFLEVVRASVPREAAVYCGCAHGVRSLHAAWMLQREGWRKVGNLTAGWDGKRDFLGRVLEPGWFDARLPVSIGEGSERSYVALRERAGLSG